MGPRSRHILLTGAVSLLLVLGGSRSGLAQDAWFGQNKVQYKDFQWQMFRTEHFEIYYHQGGEEISRFAAVVCEQAYDRLTRDFRYQVPIRVPVILYNSHNDFQQTNVTPGILQEGIGGFTEYLKHRVVVPFEGDYDDFAHVIRHELVHAVSMAMLYGTGITSLINQAQSVALPLWFEEGLAEYESLGWDMETEAFIRDAVITGYLPPLDRIWGGMLAYKGGQSFFYFLSETYGQGRLAEILGNVRLVRNLDRAMIATVGKPVKDLSEDWQLFLKRRYWPELEDRKLPGEFATPLTDHREDGAVYNVFPALSPAGDKVAFISNRRDYMDLWVISALDGSVITRLGKGEQAGQFEEMHILRGGVSWDPEGRRVAVAVKGGRSDRIHLVAIPSGKVTQTIDPGMDGVFEPTWSPDGRYLVFAGIVAGRSDLYLYDLETGRTTRLTDSPASERDPAWSHDGTRLAFASDEPLTGPAAEDDLPVHYGPRNIWTLQVFPRTGTPEPLVTGPFDESSPAWGPDDTQIIFTSFRSGVRNLYRKDLASGREQPITNIVSGVETADWSVAGNVVVFSAFSEGGFDLYLLKDPLTRSLPAVPQTPLVTELERERLLASVRVSAIRGDTLSTLGDLSRLRFRPIPTVYGGSEWDEEADRREEVPLTRDLGAGVQASVTEAYRPKLKADFVFANASYYSFWGLAGSSYLSLSDVLGNHQLQVMTSLWSTLDNSNYQFTYTYLGRRWNVGGTLFYYNYFYLPSRYSRAIYQDRNAGGAFLLSYPFSRFLRLDVSSSYLGIFRRIYEIGPAERLYASVYSNSARLVGDNTLPGYTGYVNGRRWSLQLTSSPAWFRDTLTFTSLEGDWRDYRRVGRDGSLVFRLAAGSSIGRNPQHYYIGGNGFWWGPQYASSELYKIENLYFASFQAPLRGYDFFAFGGNRFALMNIEYRFPFIHLLALGWPVPLSIPNIRGALFLDVGSAWDDWDLHPFTRRGGVVGFDDLKSGIGVGARMNLGIFILRVDVAWKNRLDRIWGQPRWHIALGPEF